MSHEIERLFYGEDLLRLIEWFEHRTAQLETNKNLFESQTLCKCFAVTVCSLLRCNLQVLTLPSPTGFGVLYRSLVEHITDLAFIAISRDERLNSRFADYALLLQYWYRNRTIAFKDEIPLIESRYRDYVRRQFPEIVEECLIRTQAGLVHEDWKAIDKGVRSRFKSHWSGLDLISRLNRIAALGSKTPFAEHAGNHFWIFSNFTHPTPYSAMPHFVPVKNVFEFEFRPGEAELRDRQTQLFMMIDAAVDGFRHCLPPDESQGLYGDFQKEIERCPRLAAWFYDKPCN